jgi:hypothetical protein
MTNQIAEVELDRIEADLCISLGRNVKTDLEKDEAYYPQFDQEIRKEAAEMAKHYEIFYCLEWSMRKLVAESLEGDKGAGWWSEPNVISPTVSKAVSDRMQKEIDSGVTPRSQDAIDYTTFGELGEIIKSNWTVFGAIFTSQKAVEKVMASLNTLRGPIAHCSALAEDEVLRLQLSLRDWFRLMD